MGVTAKVAGAPCKRCRSRFDSGHLHCAFSANGMWCKGERPCFGSRWTGFESLLPDEYGSLAHREERRCEVAQVRGSSPRGTAMRMSFNGRTSVFQTDNESSTPSIRSASIYGARH